MGFAYKGTGEVKQASAQEFKLMPEDTVFEFVIVEAEECESKQGNQMLKLVLQPTCDEFSSRKIWHYIVNNQYWEDKVAAMLASAGKDVKKEAFFEPHHIIGWNLYAKLKHEEYNGKTSEKVWFFTTKPEDQASDAVGDDAPF